MKPSGASIIHVVCLMTLLPLLSQCQSASELPKSLSFNQVQFLGSHNSYKARIDPGLMQVLIANDKNSALELDYAHVSLKEQFDMGLRKIELDVFFDPEGGMYANPLGTRIVPGSSPYDEQGLMTKPGFKVLHFQDIDFRSHCLTLRICLEQVRSWSDQHPDHFPLVITINAKTDSIDRSDFVKPLQFGEQAWADLDAEFQASLSDRIITPDDIRGQVPTLREAVLAGWPAIDDMRGKVLFVLDDSIEKKQGYMKGHPSLRGRVMFVDAPEDTPEASFRIVNDPIAKLDYIRGLVRQGFIVRTRADADTVEARSGDKGRLMAALESGAQIISTDYYLEDKRFDTGYRVSLPMGGIARCNPVLVHVDCVIKE